MNARMKFASALLVLAFVFSATCWSQETHPVGNMAYQQSPERYFRLTFRVLDMSPDGKLASSKLYNTVIASGPRSAKPSSIRTGDRVPIATGTNAPGPSSVYAQFQYLDVGTNIDAAQAAIDGQTLRLHVTADISSLSTPVTLGTVREPVIRQTVWDSNVTVPIGKATLIFSSDNSSDKGKMELELTATPISQ